MRCFSPNGVMYSWLWWPTDTARPSILAYHCGANSKDSKGSEMATHVPLHYPRFKMKVHMCGSGQYLLSEVPVIAGTTQIPGRIETYFPDKSVSVILVPCSILYISQKSRCHEPTYLGVRVSWCALSNAAWCLDGIKHQDDKSAIRIHQKFGRNFIRNSLKFTII